MATKSYEQELQEHADAIMQKCVDARHAYASALRMRSYQEYLRHRSTAASDSESDAEVVMLEEEVRASRNSYRRAIDALNSAVLTGLVEKTEAVALWLVARDTALRAD